MVESIVITQNSESNQTSYTYIAKKENSAKHVIIVNFKFFLLYLDPVAMSMGNVRIRHYKTFAPECVNWRDHLYEEAVLAAIRSVSEDPIFNVQYRRITYPKALGEALAYFPKDDAMYFATAAVRRAKDIIDGNDRALTPREKKLMQENKNLINKLRKKSAKRRSRPQY